MARTDATERQRSLFERIALRALFEAKSLLPQPPPGARGRFGRDIESTAMLVEEMRATGRLLERLSERDVADVVQRIEAMPEARGIWEGALDVATRRHLILALGVWLNVPSVLEKTGLTGIQPPESVHSMARGPVAAAGGLYEADLVADALASAGVDLAKARSGLDFGCSSGRVIRALSAAYSDVEWHGCDPNAPAIAWASDHLDNAHFFVSTDNPPLALPDASLDVAYAISIWSHFEPGLGLRWFDELARVLRPGGHLVCTTHGFTSVAFYVMRAKRTLHQSDAILGSLYRRGWWYAAEFGAGGDWGVVNPSWGTTFLSPEWMLAQLCPRWRVSEFAPGRNQENQDLYVLERL